MRPAVLTLAAALLAPLAACGGGDTVEVRLEAVGSPVEVTWSVEGGSIQWIDSDDNAWSKEIDVPAGRKVTLWVDSEGAKLVRCRIEIDGVVKAEQEDDTEVIRPAVRCEVRA